MLKDKIKRKKKKTVLRISPKDPISKYPNNRGFRKSRENLEEEIIKEVK